MEFRIADTFSNALGRLNVEEQKAVKTTVFDLQLDPSQPGLKFHRLDKPKDPDFWSVRVGRDVRLILHKTQASLLLCYTGHHDDAYRWAERRRIERHPKTGAAQLVEVRERVEEIRVPVYVDEVVDAPVATPVEDAVERPESPTTGTGQAPPAEKPPLFADETDERLLSFGVPADWLDDVRQATEDTLFELADHLPAEAVEALLDLATGTEPVVPKPAGEDDDPFEHPDAQRRFRVMTNVEELERALEAPWEKWAVFLHPAQRQMVERDFSGPARVAGSAGTGKTIVALHRAVHLARGDRDARVLLTTFSETLANALRHRLKLLAGNEPRVAERLEVHSMSSLAARLDKAHFGVAKVADRQTIETLLGAASAAAGEHRFTPSFLWSEWADVVDAWGLESWEAYRDVRRLGRKTRLAEKPRQLLWGIFQQVREGLRSADLVTEAEQYARLAAAPAIASNPPFQFAVVDEAQDISVPQLRFLAAMGGGRPNSLFFAGDQGQRIFQQPFSWKSLGVDIRGRSSRLRINYRTSHQIRLYADRLLGPEVSDVDGNVEERSGTMSVFNGVPPHVTLFDTAEEESEAVGAWVKRHLDAGISPTEVAIFVRSEEELARAVSAAASADVKAGVLDETMGTQSGEICLATMHLAKGLEFRAVAVMACDDEAIPRQSRIEEVSDESDLEDVYETERHLLYVACTRARDALLVTAIDPGSEFLEDLVAR